MKFNLNFDNIIKIENLRGEFEIKHTKYLRDDRKFEYNEDNGEESILLNYEEYKEITKDNNKIKNIKKYKTIIDKFELIGFNNNYIINIPVTKDKELLIITIWKYPLKNNKDEIFCDSLIVKYYNYNGKFIIYIKDKYFMDDKSEFIIKDSLGRIYELKISKEMEYNKNSICKTVNDNYDPIYLISSNGELEVVSVDVLHKENNFVELYMINPDLPMFLSLIYTNNDKLFSSLISLKIKDITINLPDEYELENGVKYYYIESDIMFDDIYVNNLLNEEFVIFNKNKPRLI